MSGMAAATVGSAVVTPLVCRETMCFDPNTSFWALAQAPASQALSENLRVDMAIIGGGLTGLFAAYHFGYGWGFLRGVIDFIVLRQGGRPALGKLTR